MMVDRSRVSREERKLPPEGESVSRLRKGGSLRGAVSVKRRRPLVKRGSLVGAFQLDSSNRRRTCLSVTLEWAGRAQKTSALLDSGAEESFLDATVAAQWGVPLVEVSKLLVASSLNGQRLGRITKATRPLRMRILGNHQEKISLLIIDTPHSPVVLGHPWMAKHRPQVDWARHEILEWDPSCSSRCLKQAHAPVVTSQWEESQNPERAAMERYLTESLAAGIIRPSSSPAGAGFFFVG